MRPATQPLNILLVEDSQADARLIEILLEETDVGNALTHVTSMQAAVCALAEHNFDVVLLDLGLPDGFGLDNAVRIGGLAPELPIIIMTGLDDAKTQQAARENGASGYLVKGSVIDGQELLGHIQRAVNQAADARATAPTGHDRRGGIETDLDGKITAWGHNAAAVTGFSAEQMLGSALSSLIPDSRRDEVALINSRMRRGENLSEFETQSLHHSGGLREVSLNISPRLNQQGELVGSRTAIHDITEIKRDRADAMQLAAIVAATDGVIIASTLEGTITHWNPGAEATLGYRSADMLTRNFMDIVPCEFNARTQAMMDAAHHGQPAPRVDMELQHAQGHSVPVSISLSPVRDRSGGLVGVAILAADITERQRAQAALEDAIIEQATANDELRKTLARLRDAQDQLVQTEKFASLGALVAGVAHEINTPVGVSVTAASHLRRKYDELQKALDSGSLKRSQLVDFTGQVDQATHIILTNCRRASELIQSFKQVAVDQSSSEMRCFNLKQYMHEVLLSLRPKLKPTGIKVHIECDDNLSLASVPGAYSQILANLIINSLTHAYAPNGRGQINITARSNGEILSLAYQDDGCGMTAEVKAQVFEPFFTTRRGEGGSGLGMNVVYNLITRKLGGELELTSEPGEGMRLLMSLPLRIKAA